MTDKVVLFLPMEKPKSAHSPAQIGARLRRLREAYNLRPIEVSKRLGVSRSQWALYESGDRRISIDRAIELSDLFGLTLDWIYRGFPDGLAVRVQRRLENPTDPWTMLENDVSDDQ